jgi:glutamate dehydrogenase
VARGDHFERLAVRRLIEDMLGRAVRHHPGGDRPGSADGGDTNDSAREAVQGWMDSREEEVRRALKAAEEVETSGGGWSFAKLTIANAALRELAS